MCRSERQQSQGGRVEAGAEGPTGLSDVLPALYDELRRLASGYMHRERADHTLQTTALVHEAYLRLAQRDPAAWPSRADFCAAAAQAIRRTLVDHARTKGRAKRGGPDAHRVPLDAAILEAAGPVADILDLEEALTRLEGLSPRQARVVELRFFGGMTEEETALALGVSRRTVQEDWRGARAWLQRELSR